jgi:hypothetical protein
MISRKGYPMSRNHGQKRKQKSLDRKLTRKEKEVFLEEEIKDHIKYSAIWKAKDLYSLIAEMII